MRHSKCQAGLLLSNMRPPGRMTIMPEATAARSKIAQAELKAQVYV